MINRWKSILLMHTFWTMWALESSVPFHSELRLFSVHWSVIESKLKWNRSHDWLIQIVIHIHRIEAPSFETDARHRKIRHLIEWIVSLGIGYVYANNFPFPPRNRCELNEFRDCRTIFPMAHTIYIAEKWTENFQSSPLLAMNVININTE